MNYLNLFKYIFQSDEQISNHEIEIIGNHISNLTNDNVKIDEYFNKLKIREPISLNEILDDLVKLNYQEKVTAFISACAIACSDEIDEKEYERLIEISKAFKIKKSDLNLIGVLFDLKKFKNLDHDKESSYDILEIGNSITKSDIFVKTSNLKAKIFQLDSKIYFLGFTAKGKIILNNNKILHDWIPVEIKQSDTLSVGSLNLKKDELLSRITRKNSNFKIEFSILNKTGSNNLCVTTSKAAKGSGFSILIENNFCHIINNDPNFEVLIDNNVLKLNNSKQISIDDDIIVFYKNNSTEEKLINFINIPDILFKYEKNNKKEFELSSNYTKHIIGNKYKKADIHIPSLTSDAKEIYCEVILSKGAGVLNIIKSDIDIYINDKKVSVPSIKLNHNDIIQIEKEIIICDIAKGTISTEKINIDSISVKNLNYKYNNRETALSNINFENEAGDFTCIMGPSGCGKSTLLKVMLGNINGHSGSVTYNGVDFHKHFLKLRNAVGYVPQDDLLYENLSVYDNLYYSGRLKCPELSKNNLKKRINETLFELGLSDKKDFKVGSETKSSLSGGERRRLNIGLEILTNVDVLFLDEPTSGLSSWDSKKVIDLLEAYTNKGKIVYVVIHQPSSEIYYKFNKLILLDYGGKLAFFGGTREAISYFKAKENNDNFVMLKENISPDLILDVLQKEVRDLNDKPVYEKGKNGIKRLLRKKTPQKWAIEYEDYKQVNQPKVKNNENNLLPKFNRPTIKNRLIRISNLFMRNLKDKINDFSYMVTVLAISPVLSFLLSILMKGKSSTYSFYSNHNFDKFIFLTTIIFIFLGITNSISEIIKDRARIQNERLVNIKTFDYIFTKIFTIILFSLVQVISYMLICIPILKIPFALPQYNFYGSSFLIFFFFNLFLINFSSVMIGFFISTIIKSEKSINTIIPLLIVPQIIFGGLFLSYDDMGGRLLQKDRPVPMYCDLMISRWGYESLLLTGYEYNPLNDKVWNGTIIKRLNEQNLNAFKIKNDLYNNNDIKFNKDCENKIFNSIVTKSDASSDSEENNWNYFKYKNKIFYKFNINAILEMTIFNHNVFFYRNKLIFSIKDFKFIEIPTIYYNLLVLIIYSLILFVLTLSITHKIRNVKNK